MTVIRPNSISGVTSITALANEINVFRHNGVLAGLQLNGVNHHTSAGVSTFHTVNVLGNLDVAGVLTYQDVTNVDSLGIGTFRTGINVSGGQLDVGSNIKLGNAGVITATSYRGDGSQLTGITGTTIQNNGSSRIITGSSTANTLNANDRFLYDGTSLTIYKSESSDTNPLDQSTPSNNIGIQIKNSSSTNGGFSALTVTAKDVNGNDQSGSFIAQSTSGGYFPELLITQRSASSGQAKVLQGASSGACKIFFQGGEKLGTKSYGVLVTGECRASGSFQLLDYDGSTSGYMKFGASDDLKIYHNGTDSYISNSTNKLRIGNSHNNSIKFFTQGSTRWNIDGSGHFIPDTTDQVDIGSTTYRVRNIYTMDLHCSNKGSSNDVDGTWGDFTIQEGESDLFLINNRSGKKYKFNLTEVN